jgi:hypothetical protein
MSNAIGQSSAALVAPTAHAQFTPLILETRTAIPTDVAAYHLNRAPQTLRKWACLENGPIRPVRINGRLGWLVDDIRALIEQR